MRKKAIVTGVTGQDGSWLVDLLLSKDYEVHGVARRTSFNNTGRIKHNLGHPNFTMYTLDVLETSGVMTLIKELQPDEIYNLAAQSHVMVSFSNPASTFDSIVQGTINILEAIRLVSPHSKYYNASSSEMFGSEKGLLYPVDGITQEVKPADTPSLKALDKLQYMQNEKTVMMPCSPYGVAKLAAHHMVNVYRNSYDIFACAGILFNHDSERRGETFLTAKVAKYCADLKLERVTEKLNLGNLYSKRDIGYAPEYVEGMWRMLQHDEPDDYVMATGKTYTVEEIVQACFDVIGVNNYKDFVIINDSLKRPYEVDHLCGNAAYAKEKLGWEPKTDMWGIMEKMVNFYAS